MKLISIRAAGFDTAIIIERRWWSLRRRYVGSGTVWHDSRTGRRASSHLEGILSELEWLWKQETARDLTLIKFGWTVEARKACESGVAWSSLTEDLRRRATFNGGVWS